MEKETENEKTTFPKDIEPLGLEEYRDMFYKEREKNWYLQGEIKKLRDFIRAQSGYIAEIVFEG